ncbi:MAG TPA: ABC transporter permease subunit [Tepidisphaeraceae bacterium]|nr:ABC transporter permease subunit [Tepidisphaeraceae bacterium]
MTALLIWEAAYRFVGWRSYVFPAPSHVLDAVLSMLNIRTAFGEPVKPGWPWPTKGNVVGAVASGPLIEALVVSCSRLLIGFAISVLVGVLLGVVIWTIKSVDQLLGPLFLGLQTLPSVCWVPLGILWFGINERGILFVLVMGSVFAIAISLRDGMRTIPPIYRRAGLMLGASGWKQYAYVLLPASLPALATSLRQGFSFAWRSLMGAELILAAQRHGLGFLLEIGRSFADVAQVVAVMMMMVIIGMLADRFIFAPAERRVHQRFGLVVAE